MDLQLWISRREQLAAIGAILGKAFVAHARRARPWTVCLEGDGDSGKSLIALAIDQAVNPGSYPDGLTSRISVDHDLARGRGNVAFANYSATLLPHRPDVDRSLRDMGRAFPHADILVTSNLERLILDAALPDVFNNAAFSLSSRRRDVAIRVNRIIDFNRHVAIALPASPLGQRLHRDLSTLQDPGDIEPIARMIEFYNMTDIPLPTVV